MGISTTCQRSPALAGREPRKLLEGVVEARDAQLWVPDDHRSVGVAEEVLEVVARLAQFPFDTFALGHVDQYDVDRDDAPVLELRAGDFNVHGLPVHADDLLLDDRHLSALVSESVDAFAQARMAVGMEELKR
jgi:hypothetical protein